MSVKLTLSLLVAVFAVAHCGSILDFLNFEDAKRLIEPVEVANDVSCKWKCKGPACACCIDQNITAYDQEGAKCIHMRFMSKDEGFFVQVSHGKKVEYDKIQASNPGPICLVLGVLYQMCTTFTNMAPTADGFQGCVNMEPRTVFMPQRKIPLGCFKANEVEMLMMDPPKPSAESEDTAAEESTDDEEDVEFDPNKFFAGVYQTAKQSLALLTSLLETSNTNTTAKPTSSAESSSSLPNVEETQTDTTQRRSPKSLKHPNQL